MSDKVVTTLRKAADLLESNGWTQGSYIRWKCEDGNGDKPMACFCVVAAIIESSYHISTSFDARRALANYIDPSTSIFKWNDNPNRTKEEVIKTLRDCADSLE